MMSDTPQSGLSDNAAGAIAYLTFVPAIVFLVLPPYNTSPYVRFHAWQSIFLNVAAFAIYVVLGILSVFVATIMPFGYFGGYGVWYLVVTAVRLALFIIWLICVLKAVNGGKFKLPIIGAISEQMANK
jgi:uncharacterized membrane protein